MTIEQAESIYDADTGEIRTITKILEFVESDKPDDGFEYDEVLEETDGKLFQRWIRRSEDITDTEALAILLGGVT